MKGLIYRDALVWYRRYLRIPLFIMVPGGIIVSLTLKASGVIVQESGFGFLMFLPLNLLFFFFFFFLEDEKDNWDKYLRTLQFSAKKIVMSRMIMFAGFQFACFLYSSLCGVISYLIYAEYPLMSYVVFAFVMLAFSLIGMLVVVPFPYQLGGRGVQQVVMFIFFMPLMIAGQLQNLGVSQETMTKIFLYAAIIFLIVLPFASFKFSVRFFQKKIIC